MEIEPKDLQQAKKSASGLIKQAIRDRIFPGAALALFDAGGPLFTLCEGRLHYGAWAEPVSSSTLFDLASLTKPMVTATLAMQLTEKGLLDLDRPLGEYLGSRSGGNITPRHLLTHSSGLPAHEELWNRKGLRRAGAGRLTDISLSDRSLADRKRVTEYLLQLSEKAQAPVPTYSDLGFILLGILIERLTGKGLEASFFEMAEGCSIRGLYSQALIRQQGVDAPCAPAGWCPYRRRMLRAEVHDMNAWFLGGFAGHAGLFGTIGAVTDFLARLLASFEGDRAQNCPASREMVRRFWTPGTVENSPWAMGFDLPSSKGSSAGRHFSKRSVGHLGYTGTSFWIDLERGLGMVLLSNRTFPMDTPSSRLAIKRLRPAIHDAVMGHIAAS